MTLPNDRLRDARYAAGWSQGGLAEQLRAAACNRDGQVIAPNAAMVAKWESGTKGVSRYYRILLCLLFEQPAERLGFLAPEEETTWWDLTSPGRVPLCPTAVALQEPTHRSAISLNAEAATIQGFPAAFYRL